ncbi:MAG: TonB family protein [Gammaproteobacteria bacterium]
MTHRKAKESLHPVAIAFVVLIHLTAFACFKSGLAARWIEPLPGPIQFTDVPSTHVPKPEPTPTLPPELRTFRIVLPSQPFVPSTPDETTPATAGNVARSAHPIPPAPVAPRIVGPHALATRPNPQPDYPPISRRLGEQGSVILALLVEIDGHVAEARVDSSSGHARLDEAAVAHALKRWRFAPGTEDGVPVAAWHRVRVRFTLTP